MSEVVAHIFALALALWIALAVWIAYLYGRNRERQELLPEACAAARYKLACRNILSWCCQDEFRAARLVAGHIMNYGDGNQINSGTPVEDEACTVEGLREQLRRINSELKEPKQ